MWEAMQRSLMCSYSIPPLSPHTPHTPHTHAHFSLVRNPGLNYNRVPAHRRRSQT
ncbi:hypothetical protein H6G91_04415 [Nostoc muscorum FACHB-395]|nr:hypothetical protein [Desmonostoc muscorum FACHB-395]